MPFEDHDYPQVIPTPAFSAPGAPPPWSSLSTDQRANITLDRIESQLRDAGRHYDVATPPAEPAELAALMEVTGDAPPITRRSAVLVALFEEDGESRIVLTRRSFDLKNHRGEVALPGGRSDEEEGPIETALREAHEEIGLASELVRVVGWLSPIVTFASGSAIQPVVGILDGRPTLEANPREVERIFDVSLSYLLEDGNFMEQRWRRDTPRLNMSADGTFPIFFYRVPGEVIWGATGRVITELLEICTGSQRSDAQWNLG